MDTTSKKKTCCIFFIFLCKEEVNKKSRRGDWVGFFFWRHSSDMGLNSPITL